MKYTITINQKAIVDNKLDLDLVEAAILNILHQITSNWGNISKIAENGKTYFWIAYDKILEEAPMLNISKDRVYRYIKDLCKKGFLEPYSNNQKLGRSYFMLTDKLCLTYGENTEPLR